MGMVPSLAKEVAYNSWQVELDMHRASESIRAWDARTGRLLSSWSQTRTVFVCPEISQYLRPGMNHVEWRMQTSDGSVIAKVVDWEVVQ